MALSRNAQIMNRTVKSSGTGFHLTLIRPADSTSEVMTIVAVYYTNSIIRIIIISSSSGFNILLEPLYIILETSSQPILLTSAKHPASARLILMKLN